MSYAGNKGFEYFDCLDNPSFYFDLYDLIVFCKATAWWSECDYYFFIQGQIFESNGNEVQISTPTVPLSAVQPDFVIKDYLRAPWA